MEVVQAEWAQTEWQLQLHLRQLSGGPAFHSLEGYMHACSGINGHNNNNYSILIFRY